MKYRLTATTYGYSAASGLEFEGAVCTFAKQNQELLEEYKRRCESLYATLKSEDSTEGGDDTTNHVKSYLSGCVSSLERVFVIGVRKLLKVDASSTIYNAIAEVTWNVEVTK